MTPIVRVLPLALLLAIAACKEGGGGGDAQSCTTADTCEVMPCMTAACTNMTCVYTPVDDPTCGSCTGPGDCGDGDDCTSDVCNTITGECSNPPILGCGACETDGACEDNDPCTTDTCDGVCQHAAIHNAACDSCVNDGTCDLLVESCFCKDCVGDVDCAQPAGCPEVFATGFDNFGEGDIALTGGGDIEGAGMDIIQAFDNYPDGVTENAAITNHNDCFSGTAGCTQLRVNVDITPIEFMATSGSWLHETGNTGAIAGVTFSEYTQDGAGAMTYVPSGRCFWISSVTYP